MIYYLCLIKFPEINFRLVINNRYLNYQRKFIIETTVNTITYILFFIYIFFFIMQDLQ